MQTIEPRFREMMKNELDTMSTEAVTILFETASHHLPGGTEESDDKRRYKYPGLRADI